MKNNNINHKFILGLYTIVCLIILISVIIIKPFQELTLMEDLTITKSKSSNLSQNKNLALIKETVYPENIDSFIIDFSIEKIKSESKIFSTEIIEEDSEECSKILDEISEELILIEEESSIEEVKVFEEPPIEDDNNDIRLMEYSSTRQIRVKGSSDYIEVFLYNQNESDLNYKDALLFIKDIATICQKYDYSGIPLSAMLAQAYTEGGAGKQGVYIHSNNLFGIRAGGNWDGLVYSRDLGETFISYNAAKKAGGKDLFRAYYCIEESVQDYILLIKTSNLYKGALNKSAKQYLRYLVKQGYGSSYMVDTWLYLIKIFKLSQYE